MSRETRNEKQQRRKAKTKNPFDEFSRTRALPFTSLFMCSKASHGSSAHFPFGIRHSERERRLSGRLHSVRSALSAFVAAEHREKLRESTRRASHALRAAAHSKSRTRESMNANQRLSQRIERRTFLRSRRCPIAYTFLVMFNTFSGRTREIIMIFSEHMCVNRRSELIIFEPRAAA